MTSVFAHITSEQRGVQRTAELMRIAALPRRVLDLEAGTQDGKPIVDLTDLYIKNRGRCSEATCLICSGGGEVKLWPAQSAALLDAEKSWGLFGPLGVGAGKTLLTLLLPDVFGISRAVLLVPAPLRKQLLERDMQAYGRHFNLSLNKIKVIAYSELSIERGAELLEEYKPQLIVADECHSLANFTATRTKRFLRYMRAHQDTIFCGVSGTVTKRSLKDYWHLAELALRARSPVPTRWQDIQEWAQALDANNIDKALAPGALEIFADSIALRKARSFEELRTIVRKGYRDRLVDTAGIVATSESWEGASLTISAIPQNQYKLPKTVFTALDALRRTWQIEDEEIESPAQKAEFSRQIAVGFYYRWVWPGGVKDYEWLEARAAWHKAVRNELHSSRPGRDSPLLVARAAEKQLLGGEEMSAWNNWKAVRERYAPSPPVEAVWLDDFAISHANDWELSIKRKGLRGIIWYGHGAVEDKLQASDIPVYGSGTDAGGASEDVIACSIRAQGTGKNLQRYSHNLVLEPPMSGTAWEQMIGRTHRPGQQADEVVFDVFTPTIDTHAALTRAVSDAQYVLETQGQRQKILRAHRVGW